MHFFKLIAIASAISAGLLAQNSPAPPVQAKRLPPDKSKRAADPISTSLLDRYDFGAQITALQADGSVRTGETVKPIVETGTNPRDRNS